MKITKTHKIILAAVGAIALQTAVLKVAYSYGHTDGFAEGRIGYMKTPTSNGSITVDNNGKPTFTPYANEPSFVSNAPWNSPENKKYIENQIKNNSGKVEYGNWVKNRVASATCKASNTPNLWNCSYRLLGESSTISGQYEVNPQTGDWQGKDW